MPGCHKAIAPTPLEKTPTHAVMVYSAMEPSLYLLGLDKEKSHWDWDSNRLHSDFVTTHGNRNNTKLPQALQFQKTRREDLKEWRTCSFSVSFLECVPSEVWFRLPPSISTCLWKTWRFEVMSPLDEWCPFLYIVAGANFWVSQVVAFQQVMSRIYVYHLVI